MYLNPSLEPNTSYWTSQQRLWDDLWLKMASMIQGKLNEWMYDGHCNADFKLPGSQLKHETFISPLGKKKKKKNCFTAKYTKYYVQVFPSCFDGFLINSDQKYLLNHGIKRQWLIHSCSKASLQKETKACWHIQQSKLYFKENFCQLFSHIKTYSW